MEKVKLFKAEVGKGDYYLGDFFGIIKEDDREFVNIKEFQTNHMKRYPISIKIFHPKANALNAGVFLEIDEKIYMEAEEILKENKIYPYVTYIISLVSALEELKSGKPSILAMDTTNYILPTFFEFGEQIIMSLFKRYNNLMAYVVELSDDLDSNPPSAQIIWRDGKEEKRNGWDIDVAREVARENNKLEIIVVE